MNINFQDISDHLSIYGYTVTEEDSNLIKHLEKKVVNFILQFCNIRKLPVELQHPAIEMICGDFLYIKKMNGELVDSLGNPIGGETERGETSVKVGNVTVNFESSNQYNNSSSAAALLEEEIEEMRNRKKWKKLLSKYRVLKW